MNRLLSLDTYRGIAMLFLASELLNLPEIAHHFPNNPAWQFLGRETSHVQWRGCALWDLIQPSFMFMVGVAVAFSIASRRVKGQSFRQMLRHAVLRSLIFLAPGPVLVLVTHGTHVTFEDVLTQIGLCYTFLFLTAWLKPGAQFAIALAILAGYWAAFALYPAPAPGFDFQRVGVPPDWPHLKGFAAHWDKNTNLAAAFDQWFLNLFPTSKPFVFDEWGYQTLNFVPSLATMIFGLLAGEWLRRPVSHAQKVRWLALAGTASLIAGLVLDQTGICPSVKKIWTPAWTLFSSGLVCLILAALYSIIDWRGHRRWTFPFMIVGMNSIFIYLASGLMILALSAIQSPGSEGPTFLLFQGAALVAALWLMCLLLYRRKIFLKV